MQKTLYLVPVGIGQDSAGQAEGWPLAHHLLEQAGVVFAESARSARRSMRRAGYQGDLDGKIWLEIHRDLQVKEIFEALQSITADAHGVILSEAGMPCIADPGSDVVALAHQLGIRVIPVPGPSSVFLALAASGLNGQQFVFHGYVPVKPADRTRRLKDLAAAALQTGYTQIVMETPYRNKAMIDSMLQVFPNDLRLCIAAGITSPDESIKTMPVSEWKKRSYNPGKVPALFLFGR
ncbi:MAG TPA: SAM-dependent methyltransferase [Bacteroidales bacterium]|nr:SAM-dependent methyltransferase [Bacteroidales bacterium]HRZ49377.1 SAM-dependent methyltransferase [Bacteroidales bacterium]